MSYKLFCLLYYVNYHLLIIIITIIDIGSGDIDPSLFGIASFGIATSTRYH